MGFARSRAVIPTEAKELKTKGFQLLFFYKVLPDLLGLEKGTASIGVFLPKGVQKGEIDHLLTTPLREAALSMPVVWLNPKDMYIHRQRLLYQVACKIPSKWGRRSDSPTC